MRTLFITITFFLVVLSATAQSAEDSFHSASRFFIAEQDPQAKGILDEALKKYPDDKKLRALRDQIKEKEKQKEKEQDQEKKDQEQKDKEKKEEQDKKDQEQKDKQNKEQQDKEQQEKEKQDKDQQQKDMQENNEKKEIPPSVNEKLKEMNMSEEKAKMILEAMKNQEIQYLQQNKRKATKPRDKTKPDW